MSVPEHEEGPDDEGECEECGAVIAKRYKLCGECRADIADMYADEKTSEGRRR